MARDNEKFIKYYEHITKKKILKDLKEIDLTKYFKNLDSFQRFIFEERVVPFLFLKILFHFYKEKGYILGFKQHLYEYYVGEDYETEDTGPSVMKKEITGEEAFDFFISRLGLPLIISKNRIEPDSENLIERKKPLKECLPYSQFIGEFIVLNKDKIKFALIKNEIFCNEEIKNIIIGLLEHHKKFIDPFLKKVKKLPSVPHDWYGEWLVEWFPGKVSIRTLE